MEYITVHLELLVAFDLSISEYFYIEGVRFFSKDAGYCDKSIKYLAEVLPFSEATFKRASKNLQERKLIVGYGKHKIVSGEWKKAINQVKNSYQFIDKNGIKMIPSKIERHQNDTKNGIKMIPKTAQNDTKNGIKMIPHINKRKEVNKKEVVAATNDYTKQADLLLKFLNTSIGKTSLQAQCEKLRKAIPSTNDLVNEIENWAAKTLINRGASFYTWNTNQCWAHFATHWLPRIGNVKHLKSESYEPKAENINHYRQQAAKYANY